MRLRYWLLGLAFATLVAVAGVRQWLARPGGISVSEAQALLSGAGIARGDFWVAVRDFDLDSAASDSRTAEQRSFAEALRDVYSGRREEAVRRFRRLINEAEDERIRAESQEALKRLLRAMGRWTQLREIDPEGYEGLAYADAKPQRVQFPSEPSTVPTRIGWLRVPRLQVQLNGRSYEFAVDTGADPTVITDEVAAECGIEPSKESTSTATSTSRRVEWRAGIADELRIGDVVMRNHPLAVVDKSDLDLGLVQLDGIVGWPVFEQMRVEIDYAAGVTTLSKPELANSDQERNLFWLGYPMVKLHSPTGVPLYFGLDTGARDTSLNVNVLNKLDLGTAESGRRVSIGAGGAEATSTQRVTGFEMVLSGRRFAFERASIKDGVKDLAVFEPDGRLGSDVAYGGRMVVDFANGRFELDVPVRE